MWWVLLHMLLVLPGQPFARIEISLELSLLIFSHYPPQSSTGLTCMGCFMRSGWNQVGWSTGSTCPMPAPSIRSQMSPAQIANVSGGNVLML